MNDMVLASVVNVGHNPIDAQAISELEKHISAKLRTKPWFYTSCCQRSYSGHVLSLAHWATVAKDARDAGWIVSFYRGYCDSEPLEKAKSSTMRVDGHVVDGPKRMRIRVRIAHPAVALPGVDLPLVGA